MESGGVFRFSYEDLSRFTDNFHVDNYISHFQFGKFYRGKDECLLLRHKKMYNHPGMVKLYGYCFEFERPGIVYDFDPLDSLYNLVLRDDFTWLQRIKVALRFANLLKFLHAENFSRFKPFVVRNLQCAHIVVDKDHNPKLCDFGMISGGIFPDRTGVRNALPGSIGYIDVAEGLFEEGEFQGKLDVYAFGVLLVNLISKKLYKVDEEYDDPTKVDVSFWAMEEFYEHEEKCELACDDQSRKRKGADAKLGTLPETLPLFSLVHESLKEESSCEPDDEQKISKLAIECTWGTLDDRPTMESVVSSLLELEVVKKHQDYIFGVENC